jgi:hypothetical protein
MPVAPLDDMVKVNRVGQFLPGLIGYLGESCPSQQVNYFLPAVLHEDTSWAMKAVPGPCSEVTRTAVLAKGQGL